MYTDTWQRISKSQRKKKKLGSGTDITKQDILQKTAGQKRE